MCLRPHPVFHLDEGRLPGLVEGSLDGPDSGCTSDDKHGSGELFQFRDPSGMLPQEALHLGIPVVAVLEPDHIWWRAAKKALN